jgi:putative hydrolase of the HAD superfamily
VRLWYDRRVRADDRDWLFDLDNTLYPPESGLFGAVDARINEFLAAHLGLGPAAADALRRRYHDEYGITLVGLMQEHGWTAHYLSSSTGLRWYSRADAALQPDRRPAGTTVDLHERSRRRAGGAPSAGRLFEEIFDIVTLGFRPKPDPATYRTVLERLGAEPRRTVLLDDLPRNLAPARDLGLRTVLVGTAEGSPAADFAIRTLADLPQILQRLLDESTAADPRRS